MRHPYGVDPASRVYDPRLLYALMVERYGDLRALERERFSLVVPRRKVGGKPWPERASGLGQRQPDKHADTG